MFRVQERFPLDSFDWLILSTRGLFLAALPLIAGYYGVLSETLIILFISWLLVALVASLLRAGGWRARWFDAVAAAIETGFAVGCIILSGRLESPLWWSLLIGPTRAALAYGITTAIPTVIFGILTYIIESMASGAHEGYAWAVLAFYAVILFLCTLLMGWLAERIRSTAKQIGREEGLSLSQVRELERERARGIFSMAAELSSTLNYERVLDMALDISAQSLADLDAQTTDLARALLLFTNGDMHVASDRGLTHADRRMTFPGEQGVLDRALISGEPRLTRNPSEDPELHRLVGIHGREVVLCIPLSAGLETYGVLLFAHREPHYFTAERVEILWAIAQQAMIALQNARLYRDLEQEKERITEIQEEARKKLARDLHDGPTQTIAAIAMRVNFARRLMERDPKAAADELYKVEDMARRTTKEIRHMLFTLRPLILESQGMVAALMQLAEKMHETHGQNIIIQADSDVADDMEMAAQGVVFYIAEEAINNARKHAEAEHIWVRLEHRQEIFVLEVEDDGVGFNIGAVDANYEQRGSLGIVNMRERAELVNGVLHIESSEGRGTCITVYVPLTADSVERLHKPGFVV
jgi:signal transduction histidine kinase